VERNHAARRHGRGIMFMRAAVCSIALRAGANKPDAAEAEAPKKCYNTQPR